jgi:hypothetical protein
MGRAWKQPAILEILVGPEPKTIRNQRELGADSRQGDAPLHVAPAEAAVHT